MSVVTSPSDATGSASPKNNLRLDFLDGLRAIAALYVMLHHAPHVSKVPLQELPYLLQVLVKLGQFGHFAVGLFIVISGYCLMLPVARTPDHVLKGGLASYLKRRSRRILPPYYIALVFATVLAVFTLFIRTRAHRPVGDDFATLPGSVISHILLVHNMKSIWLNTIDSPCWSIAVEWQIYFLFPLLLLPIWKRFGNGALIAFALVLGYLPHFLLPLSNNFDWTCPWYIGLFSLGMVAASISFSNRQENHQLRRLPWAGIALCSVFILGIALIFHPEWGENKLYWWIDDLYVGIASMVVLISCAEARKRSVSSYPLFLKVLESRYLVMLGVFSYSIYLTHHPLLFLVAGISNRFHVSQNVVLIISFVSIPFLVGVAYLFYTVFERPFTSYAPSSLSR